MSISCDCSVDIDDYADIYREEFPKARKTHKCCECRGEIKPGQKYQNSTMLFDGHWDQFKTCMPCYHIRRRYCPNGSYIEGLRERISDCLGFDYTEVPHEN